MGIASQAIELDTEEPKIYVSGSVISVIYCPKFSIEGISTDRGHPKKVYPESLHKKEICRSFQKVK